MSKNWLANYATEEGVQGQRSYTKACGDIFSFCSISQVWKWWWWVEGMGESRVGGLPSK